MPAGVVQCKCCGKEKAYNDCQCLNDIIAETEYYPVYYGEYLCPECFGKIIKDEVEEEEIENA